MIYIIQKYDWSEEVFVIRKVKNTVLWIYVINHFNNEEIIGTFYEEKKTTKDQSTRIRIRKVIQKKGDKLYVKWKGYDTLFNSWIDKKDVV